MPVNKNVKSSQSANPSIVIWPGGASYFRYKIPNKGRANTYFCCFGKPCAKGVLSCWSMQHNIVVSGGKRQSNSKTGYDQSPWLPSQLLPIADFQSIKPLLCSRWNRKKAFESQPGGQCNPPDFEVQFNIELIASELNTEQEKNVKLKCQNFIFEAVKLIQGRLPANIEL